MNDPIPALPLPSSTQVTLHEGQPPVQAPHPAVVAVARGLVAANTQSVGVIGWLTTIGLFLLVAVTPDLGPAVRAHLPPIAADLLMGVVSATAALLGRVVTYENLPKP